MPELRWQPRYPGVGPEALRPRLPAGLPSDAARRMRAMDHVAQSAGSARRAVQTSFFIRQYEGQTCMSACSYNAVLMTAYRAHVCERSTGARSLCGAERTHVGS